ncbi:nuclear transport factor 2 family protein [Amycolatopsis sp. cmx-11-12]|uniref:nuclear transport factor 2 family protein n=1 Tax=Amycolatopsis sp. cmx-11-12 TaxID=2785795 RepID=UPI0039170F2F
MTSTTDIETFVSRYAAVWNEPDPARRSAAIAALWGEDGVEFISSADYRGHDAIQARVADAHEQFVATGGFRFVAANDALHHHDAVTFTVHMVPAVGGEPVWTGVVFALLGEDGRMQRDYQFTGAEAATRAVVTEFLARLAEGKPEQIAELFADAVDWQLDWPAEGHPAVPWIRPRSTRAEVADHFRALDTFHVPEKRGGVAPRILVDGPDAVVLGEIRQTVKATGSAYIARCALHLTIDNGLIARYHVYEDSLTVAQALSGSDL